MFVQSGPNTCTFTASCLAPPCLPFSDVLLAADTLKAHWIYIGSDFRRPVSRTHFVCSVSLEPFNVYAGAVPCCIALRMPSNTPSLLPTTVLEPTILCGATSLSLNEGILGGRDTREHVTSPHTLARLAPHARIPPSLLFHHPHPPNFQLPSRFRSFVLCGGLNKRGVRFSRVLITPKSMNSECSIRETEYGVTVRSSSLI